MAETVNITPLFSPHVVNKALTRAGITTMRAGDHGGVLIEDGNTVEEVLGQLVGAVMTLYVTETMVMDSNAVSIRKVAEELAGEAEEGRFPERYGSIREFRDYLASLAERLTDISANL